ncbi:DUF1127 domain-containing protein [Thauera sp.]|jgi:hypothetical protein|uniref:DUF1127 domain-containing protein n=1 Tax=Thauera sp. TaxID=1905334 RepID=UPI002A36EB64|nr:DUF1127 domain-containing protein [Thauera sp.]MDX9886464.1 DUF1127 domain-containing protein [Thauera sp.]
MKALSDPRLDASTTLPGKPARRIRRALDEILQLAAYVAAALREARTRRRAARALRVQRRLLADLDERTLKDIGLHRAELDSLCAELEGQAEPSRRHSAKNSVAPLY